MQKLQILLYITIAICIPQNSYAMYRSGLKPACQHLTSLRNTSATSLTPALRNNLSIISSLGSIAKKNPFLRTCTVPLSPQRRFLSSEMQAKLLERIRIASKQGDERTVKQTINFIKENVPEIEHLAQKATTEAITQQQPDFSHNHFSEEFYDESFEDMLNRHKRYKGYSPLREVEDKLERNFEEHAQHKIHVTLNNTHPFPSATWKELLTRDFNPYMDRVYAWIFDENHLKFTFEPFSSEEKKNLLHILRHYIQIESKKKNALEELKDLLSHWDPVCGHTCNQPETIRMGIRLFGNAYNEAIKKNILLMESIRKNISSFTPTNDDLNCSYVAGKLIHTHMCDLVEFHQKELLQLFDELQHHLKVKSDGHVY